MKNLLFVLFILGIQGITIGQVTLLNDDFEGNGDITQWNAIDGWIDSDHSNPHMTGINTSAKVLKYKDQGGLYANTQFDISSHFDMSSRTTFLLKIYVPSDSITGNSPNQISLKLQNNTIAEPWVTQSEIIKPIVLDQWQEMSFDFENDNFINYNQNSSDPTTRTDFNRVVIQLNGENNSDQVIAYIDDVSYGYPNYETLVWSDEFDGSGAIDTNNWHHQTILPNGNSWYNNEVQHYTDRVENSFEENGMLHINAKKETFVDQAVSKDYTSARLNSKFAFQYGRVLMRAKLPTGLGTWPALWALSKNITETGTIWNESGFGTTPWPQCGEIDIMEHWGDNQDHISSALHTTSSHGGTINTGGRTVSNVSTEFHLYELIWSANKLVFKVDGIIHYVYRPSVKNTANWPFDAEQFLLFNVALLPDITTTGFTEDAMEVDYVRVYQGSNAINTFIGNAFSETDAKAEFSIENGDILIEKSEYGTIYTTPNGSCYRLTIDDNGNTITTLVECPE